MPWAVNFQNPEDFSRHEDNIVFLPAVWGQGIYEFSHNFKVIFVQIPTKMQTLEPDVLFLCLLDIFLNLSSTLTTCKRTTR